MKRDKKNLYPVLRLAQILCNDQGNYQEARKRLKDLEKQSESKNFEEAKVFELNGDISLGEDEQNNLDQALRAYIKAGEKDPKNVPLLVKIGKCQDRKREYEKASEAYSKVLAIEPKNFNIQFK